MLLAMMILSVTVEVRTNEPVVVPVVVADGTPVVMDGKDKLWHGTLANRPRLISATFEDPSGNQGTAFWNGSWTPTPTDTPTPPPAISPATKTTPGPESAETSEPAAAPTMTSTATISPTPTQTPTPRATPTPTIVPHSWQTTGSFGWRYTGEILEATHARFEGHDGFILDGLDGLSTPGSSEGSIARAEWETLPGKHTIAYRWRTRVKKHQDVIDVTFRENGWPVDTDVVSEDGEGRTVSDGMSPGRDPAGP